VTGQVESIENPCEFRPAVLLVRLVSRILCARLYVVRVRGLNRSAHPVARGSGRFEEREEVRSKDDLADVVHCHVSVDAVLGRLVGRDSSSRVQDQEIQAVDLRGDLFGGISGGKGSHSGRISRR
jgi:hypothetical protein